MLLVFVARPAAARPPCAWPRPFRTDISECRRRFPSRPWPWRRRSGRCAGSGQPVQVPERRWAELTRVSSLQASRNGLPFSSMRGFGIMPQGVSQPSHVTQNEALPARQEIVPSTGSTQSSSRPGGGAMPRQDVLQEAGEVLLAALQAVALHVIVRRFRRGEAVVPPDHGRVAAQRGKHIGVDLKDEVPFGGIAYDALQIARVVRREGAVELDEDACLPQQGDGAVHAVKHAAAAAQGFVGLIARAVERDVDACGRMLGQPGHAGLIQQGAVGVDGDEEAHRAQPLVKRPEVLPQERLAAGQQQIEHTCVARLLGDGQPLDQPDGRTRRGGDLGGRLTHIAHLAGEVAHRRKLKGTAQRRECAAGAVKKILCQAWFNIAFRLFHVPTPLSGSRPRRGRAYRSGRRRERPAPPAGRRPARHSGRPIG